MPKHIKYLLFFLVLHIPFISYSQNTNPCLKNLLELNLSEAKINISQLKYDYEKLYFQYYYYFIQHKVFHLPFDEYTKATDSIQETTNKFNKFPSYRLSEIHLQKGIIEYVNDNFYSAIKNFNSAYKYWQQSETDYPGNINNLKLNGIFNLLLAHLPSPYKEWAEWFGFKGDNKAGFMALYQYYNVEETIGQHTEAKLYLAFAMLKFMDKDNNIEAFLQKELEQENTDFIKNILIRCAFKIRKPDIFKDWFLQVNSKSYPQLHYLKGKYLVQLFSSESIDELSAFLHTTTDNTFKADTYRYLSWISLIKNNKIKYREFQNKLKSINDYPAWEDKQAFFESSLSYDPNKTILESRLLFDRGEYDKCLDLLKNTKNQFWDKNEYAVEYYYRLGRSYQMINDYENAISNYNFTIELNKYSNRYFSPEAAVNIAKIEISRGHYSLAEVSLEKAKTINKGENKNSINQEIKQLQKEIESQQK